MRLGRLLYAVGALALVAVLGYLVVMTGSTDLATGNEIVATLGQLKQVDSEWNVDVLRKKAGIDVSYDAVANPLPRISALSSTLRAKSERFWKGDPQGEITVQPLLDAYTAAMDRKIAFIEQFKSQDAILRNSSRFLPLAASDVIAQLHTGATSSPQRTLAERLVSVMLVDTMSYQLAPDPEVKKRIETTLAQLSDATRDTPADVRDAVDMMIAHATTVLTQQKVGNELLGQLALLPTAVALDALRDAYLLKAEEMLATRQRYGQALAAFSILLLVILAWIGWRLFASYKLQGTTNLVLSQAEAVARLGSWHLDLASGAIQWSAQARQIFDVPEGVALSDAKLLERVHPDDRLRLREVKERTRLGESYAIEYRVNGAGCEVWVLDRGEVRRDGAGRVASVVGTVQDISERKASELKIARLAYVDSLTGLANRESFIDQLGREVERARQDGKRLAVLFMDLDGFKTINDTLGHQAGDAILTAAAARLLGVVRGNDVVSRATANDPEAPLARLGGDEFTALLTNIVDAKCALAVARRISEAIRTPFEIGDRELSLTASIGIAVFPDDGKDVETLLKYADTAMYSAKEQGRNNVQLYDASLTERATTRMNLEQDLRQALDRDEFHLLYQPQVDARTGTVVGVEALIRWKHPRLGYISPLDFIPIAEANGLIVPIGQWVILEACRMTSTWYREGWGVPVAVNLSAVQLKDPSLVQYLSDCLDEYQLPPECLEVELTESTLMADSDANLATLKALRGIGVSLALDDFGTGFSSMSYLKRMPLASLKVDRSFVAGLPGDVENEAILRAVVSMSKSLGLKVTAEGVETIEQAELLREIGCDTLQGYYFSRPIAATAVEAFVVPRVQVPMMPEAIAA